MSDNFVRIAEICLDIVLIALMVASLVWNPPAFKTNVGPAAAQPEIQDVR
jgi:hypothetical protein